MEKNHASSSLRNELRDAWQECLRLMRIIRGGNNENNLREVNINNNASNNTIDRNKKWNREHIRIWRQEIYDFILHRHQYNSNGESNLEDEHLKHGCNDYCDKDNWKKEEEKYIGEFLLALFYMNENKNIKITDVEQQDWIEQFLPFFLNQQQDDNYDIMIWNRYILPSVQRIDVSKEEKKSKDANQKRRRNILLTVMRLFSTRQIGIVESDGSASNTKNKLVEEWVKLWKDDNQYSEHDVEWTSLLLTCCSQSPLEDDDLSWWDDCLWKFISLQINGSHSKSSLAVCTSIQSTVPTMSLTTLIRIVKHPSSQHKQKNHCYYDCPILLLWIWQSLKQNFSTLHSILVPILHQNNQNRRNKRNTNKKTGSNLYDKLLQAIQRALLFQLPWDSYARTIQNQRKNIASPGNDKINIYHYWMEQLSSFSTNESHYNNNSTVDNTNQLTLWMQSFATFEFVESTGLQFSMTNTHSGYEGCNYEIYPNSPFINPILSIYSKWVQTSLLKQQVVQRKEHITHLWIRWILSSTDCHKRNQSNILYFIQSMAILGTLWHHVPSSRRTLLQSFVLEQLLLHQSTIFLKSTRMNESNQHSYLKVIVWLQIFVQLSSKSNDCNQKLFLPIYQQLFSSNMIISPRVIVALCRVIDWNLDSHADIIFPYIQKKKQQQQLHTLHCLSLVLKKKTTFAIERQAVYLMQQIVSSLKNNEKNFCHGYNILSSNWSNYNSWTQQYLQITSLAIWFSYFFSLQKNQDPIPLFQFLVKILLLHSPLKHKPSQDSVAKINDIRRLDPKDLGLHPVCDEKYDTYKPEEQHDICRRMFWFTFNIICRDLKLSTRDQQQNEINGSSLEKIQFQCQRWIPYLIKCINYHNSLDTKNNYFSLNPLFENMQSEMSSKSSSKERWPKFLRHLTTPCVDSILSIAMSTTNYGPKKPADNIFALLEFKRTCAPKSNVDDLSPYKLSSYDKDKEFVSFFNFCKHYFLSVLMAPGEKLVTKNDIDLLLKAILWQCSDFQIYYNRVHHKLSFNLSKALIISFWEFHQSVCSEESSSRFLSYLEAMLIQGQNATFKSSEKNTECNSIENFSIFSIQKSNDLDTFLRQFRLVILTSLECIVSKCQNVVDECRHDILLLQHPFEFLDIWAKIVSCLCQDLFAGLKGGHSGGITRIIYKKHVNIIDKCIQIINTVVDQPSFALSHLVNNDSGYMKLLNICDEASQSIWSILCEFHLRNSSTFKPSMMLCLCQIPRLRRCLTQSCLLMNTDLELFGNDPEKGSDSTTTFTTFTLQHCHSFLHEWYQNYDQDNRTFHQHPLEINIQKESTNLVDYEIDEHLVNDRNNYFSQEKESQKSVQTKHNVKLQIGSSEVWAWACFCSLQAVEFIWTDVTKFMQGNSSLHNIHLRPHDMKVNDKFETRIVSYAHRHTSELRRVLESTCLFFEPLTNVNSKQSSESDTEGKQSDSLIGAELLSFTCKSRLCVVLERVTIALKTSIRFLELCVNDSNSKKTLFFKSDDFYENNHELNQSFEFALVESLSCLLSWIHPYSKKVAFTTLTRRWHLVEKLRNLMLKEKPESFHYNDDPILSRIPKVLLRFEEMEVQLQKLYKCLSKCRKYKKCNIVLKKIDYYCQEIGRAINNKGGKNEKNTIYHILTDFILLANRHEAELSEFFSSASTTARSSNDKVGDCDKTAPFTNGSKRSNNTGTQKKLKRIRTNVPRSRNEVVDRWLKLDSAFSKEEDSPFDTFADLEDFIEEG